MSVDRLGRREVVGILPGVSRLVFCQEGFACKAPDNFLCAGLFDGGRSPDHVTSIFTAKK